MVPKYMYYDCQISCARHQVYRLSTLPRVLGIPDQPAQPTVLRSALCAILVPTKSWRIEPQSIARPLRMVEQLPLHLA